MLRSTALVAALVSLLGDPRCQAPNSGERSPQDPQAPAVSKGDVARAVDEYLAANPPVVQARPWELALQHLQFYGDLRLRAESDFERDDRVDRHRQRIRLRFGADYRVNDEITVGARIVTGDPDDPNSPHVTLGDVLNSEVISVDRAFLQYQPGGAPGWSITAGKFNHPFARNPVYGELVWDADVQPEGLIASYDLQTQQRVEHLALTAGIYPLLEQNDASEAYVSVIEASSRVRLADAAVVDASVAYYLYSDTTPSGATTLLADNPGNATVDRTGDGKADAFASHFGILHPIVSLTFDRGDYPLTFAAEYIRNLRTDLDKDEGFAVGVAYGSTRQQGDWRAYYQWQVVEREAVFSAFAQDDFPFATNHRSHGFGVNYQMLDTAGLHVWTLVSAPDQTSPGPTTDGNHFQWRFRIDMNLRF